MRGVADHIDERYVLCFVFWAVKLIIKMCDFMLKLIMWVSGTFTSDAPSVKIDVKMVSMG